MWRNFAELRDINRAGGAVFEPQITRDESAQMFGEWEKAVQMSKGWIQNSPSQDNTGKASSSHDAKANGTPGTVTPAGNRNPPPTTTITQPEQPLISDMVRDPSAITALKATTLAPNGEAEFPPARTPLISISSDLDGADEEELFLELRKVEILQRLKKLRKLKLSYY
jgi:glycerol kinase